MQKSNEYQLRILTHLLFNPMARFKDLNTEKLSSDTFSYHVNVLQDLGLITKVDNYYMLTAEGKITAAKLDTEKKEFEKQPKVSVFVIAHKEIDGEQKFILHQRQKEPYFGYHGFMTGKVRWGETLAEASERELQEETGMSGDHKFCFQIHEQVYDKKTNKLLEDKFFQVMEAYNLKGALQENMKEGLNKWVTAKEFFSIEPKFHNEDDFMRWFLEKDFTFKEEKYFIDEF